MDRETAVEFERIKALVHEHSDKIRTLEGKLSSWEKLAKTSLIQATKKFFLIGLIGIAFGWHLPEGMRKWLIDWITK